jgi:hypothetical protein
MFKSNRIRHSLRIRDDFQKSRISNLQSPISNLQSPISNLQSPIINHQSPISNLQSPISNLQSSIINHQSPISNLQSPISNLQSSIINLQSLPLQARRFFVHFFLNNPHPASKSPPAKRFAAASQLQKTIQFLASQGSQPRAAARPASKSPAKNVAVASRHRANNQWQSCLKKRRKANNNGRP